MPKGLIALFLLLICCGLLLNAGGYSSPLSDTAPFDQPPTGLSITLSVDTFSMQITVWVSGDNQILDQWDWSDPQSDGRAVSGKMQSAVSDCQPGTGRYSGYVSFYKHHQSASGATKQQAAVVHRVGWATPASACLSSEFKLVVYSPGE